ncbi:hypothetical protein Bbelb_038090 [Branchiostoma belcheri]|nr:hypothetical protein Bbelb_038090 [Branchiostoma belcheri]
MKCVPKTSKCVPGAGEAISREPGSEAPGAGRGVPVVGAVGSREREQQGPGNGSNGSREREQTGPESGAGFGRGGCSTGRSDPYTANFRCPTHGAVHGHFLPCTGMYRDRVRAYTVQYTTCTQKVVHFRECTGHVRDWTRFVCRHHVRFTQLRDTTVNPKKKTTHQWVRQHTIWEKVPEN